MRNMSKLKEFLKELTDKTELRRKAFKAGIYEVLPLAQGVALKDVKTKWVDASVVPADPDVANYSSLCKYYIVNRNTGAYVGDVTLNPYEGKRRTAQLKLGDWVQEAENKDITELLLQLVSWSYDNVLVSLYLIPIADLDLRLLKAVERAKFKEWKEDPKLLLNNQYARGIMSSVIAKADW